MSLQQQVFTNAGIDLLGQADAGATLTIEKIVVGSGSASGDSDIYPLTALISWKADVTIVRKTDLGSGKMLVSGLLNEWELTGSPFQLKELGIMAHTGTLVGGTHGPPVSAPGVTPPTPGPGPSPLVIPPGTSVLYCASNVYADAPDTVTPGGLNQHAFDITVEIDRASDVTVVIGDASTVDCRNIPADATVGPGWYAMREGNIFDFKRLVKGTGIYVIDSGDRIEIGVSTLKQNIDLYVPVTYASPPPGTDPSQLFPSIQAAHDYLLTFIIPPDKFATIHVDAGVFNVSPPQPGASCITFSHPNSKQINVIGRPRVDKTGTGIQYIDANSKSFLIANVSGIPTVAGYPVYVALPIGGGSGQGAGWAGGCLIYDATIRPGSVKLNTFHGRTTRPNYTLNIGGSPRLSWYPTVIQWLGTPGTGQFLWNFPNGIGQIENLTLKGGGYCVVMEFGSIKNCMIQGNGLGVNTGGTRRGISGGSGTIGIWGDIVITDCDFGIAGIGVVAGFEAAGPPLLPFLGMFNSCGTALAPSPSGMAVGTLVGGMDNTFVWINHCQTGVGCSLGANFQGGSNFMSTNDVNFLARQGGLILLGAGGYPTWIENGGAPYDVYAQGGAYIEYNRGGGQVPVCSPTAEAAGNQNAFIHVTNVLSLA